MVRENGMVMMTEKELTDILEGNAKEINNLKRMLMSLLHRLGKNKEKDIKVTRKEFVELYEKAVDCMFDNLDNGIEDDDKNEIYGHDVTVHWHGLYCNCLDGAAVSNHIIPGIKGLMEEYDDYYDDEKYDED